MNTRNTYVQAAFFFLRSPENDMVVSVAFGVEAKTDKFYYTSLESSQNDILRLN